MNKCFICGKTLADPTHGICDDVECDRLMSSIAIRGFIKDGEKKNAEHINKVHQAFIARHGFDLYQRPPKH